jgi:hypothetical protein
MTMDHHEHHDDPKSSALWRVVLVGFLAIGAFYLYSEHRAHLFGALPFVLLLLCPLMHLFMHHGHGKRDQ